MRVSQKTEYALRAMLELAKHAQQPNPVRTMDIARNQAIPEKFLESILVELRRSSLVTSQRGPVGGHRLAREAERISVGDIWRAIEGPPDDSQVAKSAADGRNKRVDNPFGFVWQRVNLAVAEAVDGVSLEDVLQRSESGEAVEDFAI
ncbi:MAG: Rrf2 family transcriptional regulator [Planctomycetota bacterium]